jgi:hypothetical protein
MTGDFLQLPPVRISDSEPYDWAFQSPVWSEVGVQTFGLKKVRRQDEPEFVEALADFRIGRVRGRSARLLQSRVQKFPPASMPRLFTHNIQVDRWNNLQLSELPGEPTTLEAAQTGPEHQRAFLTKNLLTPASLRLKPGALVMFTVNKNERGRRKPRFVNGQMGTVEDLTLGAVVVRCGDGELILVEPFTWHYDAQDQSRPLFRNFRSDWPMR